MKLKVTRSWGMDRLISAIKNACERNPLGVEVTIDLIKPAKTTAQNNGLWLLYGKWLKLSRLVGVDAEDLHKWVCCHHFGKIEREWPDGTIDWIPLRTTTRVWDHDARRYRRKKLSREDESELIEAVYRIAAEGGVVLPELERQE